LQHNFIARLCAIYCRLEILASCYKNGFTRNRSFAEVSVHLNSREYWPGLAEGRQACKKEQSQHFQVGTHLSTEYM
jgi:hypothetical protein